MSEPRIPFNRPSLAGREFEYISDAIAHGPPDSDLSKENQRRILGALHQF